MGNDLKKSGIIGGFGSPLLERAKLPDDVRGSLSDSPMKGLYPEGGNLEKYSTATIDNPPVSACRELECLSEHIDDVESEVEELLTLLKPLLAETLSGSASLKSEGEADPVVSASMNRFVRNQIIRLQSIKENLRVAKQNIQI